MICLSNEAAKILGCADTLSGKRAGSVAASAASLVVRDRGLDVYPACLSYSGCVEELDSGLDSTKGD